MNRKLAVANALWRENAASMKEQEMLLKRGAMRMVNRKYALALVEWRDATEWAHEEAQRQETMARACRRMLKGSLLKAFVHWRNWARQRIDPNRNHNSSPDHDCDPDHDLDLLSSL